MTGGFRTHDPSTSFEAALAVDDDMLTRLQHVVVEQLGKNVEGLTTVEIGELAGIDRDTISPRMKALVEKGIVFNSGQKRVPPGKKRKSIVWKLADQEQF